MTNRESILDLEKPSGQLFIDTSNNTLLPDDELAWQQYALCAQTDPEAFFPEQGNSTKDAKKVCGGCAVRAECLSYALANNERFGVWGGLSERDRRRLKRLIDAA